MKLDKILKNIEILNSKGNLDVEINDISIKSNEVSKNTLFICINGVNIDGHDFALEAEKFGAIAIVCEREIENVSIAQIIVKDSRSALSKISSNFYGNPEKKLKIIGITGTNGKTTTTFIIKHLFIKSNINCGIIGTLGIYYKDKYIENNLTTPDPIELFKYLKEMKDNDIQIVVMEVSAHSLYLKKIEGITFDVGVFTNLTQDHLDFFKNMEEYKSAKMLLFDKCKYIVSNIDDKVGKEICDKYNNAISYGIENPCDNFAIDIMENGLENNFILNIFDNVMRIKTKLLGRFNVYNVLSAVTACFILGLKCESMEKSLEDFSGVNGRLELVYNKEFKIYIDYAHTPDGLKNSILTLKNNLKGKLICVFGCGGNRDSSKRKIMGEISGKYADFTVITTDNPRYEEPFEIILQIEEGIKNVSTNYVLIEDRVEGIKYAIEKAKEEDIILIAGKGAENYQEVLGIKHEYNDKNVINKILSIC